MGIIMVYKPTIDVVWPQELPKTLSAARRLSAFLRRFVAPRFPAPATASAVTQFGTVVAPWCRKNGAQGVSFKGKMPGKNMQQPGELRI